MTVAEDRCRQPGAMKKQTINEVMEQKAEKRKRYKKRVKRLVFWIKSIFMLALFISAVIFTGLSPLFNLKEIEVKGSVYYSAELLKGYTDIQIGENGFKQLGSGLLSILQLRFNDAEASIMEYCPYIKTVKARYSIPSRAVISVTERTAEFTVPYSGTSLIIDREGYVLERVQGEGKQKLIMLKGLVFSEFELGKKLNIKNKESIDNGLMLIEAVKENDRLDNSKIFEIIDSIDTGDEANLQMSLEQRITVNFGDMKDLNYKISTVKTIFSKNIKKGEKGTLDFTTGPNPVFSPETEDKK